MLGSHGAVDFRGEANIHIVLGLPDPLVVISPKRRSR